MVVTCNQGLEMLAGAAACLVVVLGIGIALGTMQAARRRAAQRTARARRAGEEDEAGNEWNWRLT